jgi:hypothetical protein
MIDAMSFMLMWIRFWMTPPKQSAQVIDLNEERRKRRLAA